MKRLLTALFFLISVTCFSQKTDTIPKNDEPLLTITQVNKVLEEMKKNMTIDLLPLYTLLLNNIQVEINVAVQEWKRRKKLNK